MDTPRGEEKTRRMNEAEDLDKKDTKSQDAAAESVHDSFDASEVEDELNPVGLNKAFRFAAWSSLALVRDIVCISRIVAKTVAGGSFWSSSSSFLSRCSSLRSFMGPLV